MIASKRISVYSDIFWMRFTYDSKLTKLIDCLKRHCFHQSATSWEFWTHPLCFPIFLLTHERPTALRARDMCWRHSACDTSYRTSLGFITYRLLASFSVRAVRGLQNASESLRLYTLRFETTLLLTQVRLFFLRSVSNSILYDRYDAVAI